MPKSENQKLKMFYTQKMLWEETDETHSLTVNQIIAKLGGMGIKAERKSVYDDIEALQSTNEFDVVCVRSRSNCYHMGQRLFELPEVKLLVDAVAASKFITAKKSRQLIDKLRKMVSKYDADSLQRQVKLSNRIKNEHETIYYDVDKIHKAIAEGKKISFNYWEWDLDKKEKLRKNGEKYLASPCAFCWDNDCYYLVTYSEKYKNFVHYRVDKMSDVELTDVSCDYSVMPKDFDISSYATHYFGMFAGDLEQVTIYFDNSLINTVIDRFGRKVKLKKVSAAGFEVTVNVAVSNVFLSWLMQFGTEAKVLGPSNVVRRMRKLASSIAKSYK